MNLKTKIGLACIILISTVVFLKSIVFYVIAGLAAFGSYKYVTRKKS